MNPLNPSLFTIKRLDSNVDIGSFQCSEPKLTEYLIADALRDQQYFYSTTNLVYYTDILVGYFTLITDSMNSNRVDKEIVLKYEYSKVPSVKIARLAVDSRFTGCGIGSTMMSLIFSMILDMLETIGCRLITVDSKQNAKSFYEKFGFKLVISKQDIETIPMYLDVKELMDALNQ